LLDVVTPERVLLSDQVVSTIAPGSEGVLEVLVDHAPLMTELVAGEVRAAFGDGRTTSHIVVSGGFLEVTADRTTILADSAERVDEIDVTRAEEDLAAARRLLAEAVEGSAEAERARQASVYAEAKIRVGRDSD
jgi:F-type H+-transporting ATPase subunit epsilon